MPIDDLEARAWAVLASPRLSAPTRRVLGERLERRFDGAPRALSVRQFDILSAACLRLIPEPELVARVQLARAFDARLASGESRGWRYAEAPGDLELVAAGLDALDRALGGGFVAASPADQDEALRAAQAGEGEFSRPSLRRWFEEVASALCEFYYGHPLVQLSIGYDGMMDRGPRAVGFEAVAREGARLDL